MIKTEGMIGWIRVASAGTGLVGGGDDDVGRGGKEGGTVGDIGWCGVQDGGERRGGRPLCGFSTVGRSF